jgi:hypothetical protein
MTSDTWRSLHHSGESRPPQSLFWRLGLWSSAVPVNHVHVTVLVMSCTGLATGGVEGCNVCMTKRRCPTRRPRHTTFSRVCLLVQGQRPYRLQRGGRHPCPIQYVPTLGVAGKACGASRRKEQLYVQPDEPSWKSPAVRKGDKMNPREV